jgi:regulatory protein
MAHVGRPPKNSTPKSLDRQAIEEKALAYLDRFDASAARLRRVLDQFVRQRAQELRLDAGPFLTIVGETLERYRQSGLVDDRRFGATMARSLAERGASRQAIKTKLIGRGVAADVIDEVVQALNQNGGSELDAARALVKKRKLGNYRPASERRENFRRDLGVLARAGFAFDTAKTALGVEGAEDDEGF